jgi:hypothetical protein
MKKIMLSMSFIAIAVSSVFFACRKVNNKDAIGDKVEISNATASNQKVLAPLGNMAIYTNTGGPYTGGAKLKVYLNYCDAICSQNAHGEISSIVSGVTVPSGGYSNQNVNGFDVEGFCSLNVSKCEFRTGTFIGSWGKFYYLKSSVNLAGGATKILKVQFKQGLPVGSFGGSFPYFHYIIQTNNWNYSSGTVLPTYINYSVIDPATLPPSCNCSN